MQQLTTDCSDYMATKKLLCRGLGRELQSAQGWLFDVHKANVQLTLAHAKSRLDLSFCKNNQKVHTAQSDTGYGCLLTYSVHTTLCMQVVSM